MPIYFESDLGSDIVGGLSLAARLSEGLKTNQSAWKWCVVAVHSTLQSAMILVLAGSDGAGAYKEKSQERYRAWIRGELEGSQYPDVRLAGFEQLYKWVKEPDKTDGKPLKSSTTQDHFILRLNTRRDNLSHHEELAWLMDIGELKGCILSAMDAIEQLLRHPRMILSIALDDAIRNNRCSKLIDAIRQNISEQPETA